MQSQTYIPSNGALQSGKMRQKSSVTARTVPETDTSSEVVIARPSPFLRKPLWVVAQQEGMYQQQGRFASNHSNGDIHRHEMLAQEDDEDEGEREENDDGGGGPHLPRHLTLLDLVSVGVGGTIGSGVFVLCGLIARDYAGPATCISWAIAGAAAFLSGFGYAELSGQIPSAGSSYAYAYVSIGELPAFVTASMLTLEFLVSGSAVARSWGDKVVEWLKVEVGAGDWVSRFLDPGYGFNPMAFLISIITSSLVYGGVQESKIVTDVFTWLKVLLVVFMSIGGLLLLKPSNLKPFVPPEFGYVGVMRGATSSFFGYLGFDGICCVAGEAKNPTYNLPLSVMITLVLVTILYIVAAFSLTGMQHYTEISTESGFPEAFEARGVQWVAQLTAFGEIFTLPVVVLLSNVLQPRLMYALAVDGLLPPLFKEVNQKGNLRKGILVSGSLMSIFAAFVPFTYLDDFVSAGILIAFTVTNSSLILLRHESPQRRPLLLQKLLILTNLLSLITGLVIRHDLDSVVGVPLALFFGLSTLSCIGLVSWVCPRTVFGGRERETSHDRNTVTSDTRYFAAPWLPFVPLFGNFANWYLVAQLSYLGIGILFLYITLASVLYFSYGAKNSVGSKGGWGQGEYEVAREVEMANDHNTLQNGATSRTACVHLTEQSYPQVDSSGGFVPTNMAKNPTFESLEIS